MAKHLVKYDPLTGRRYVGPLETGEDCPPAKAGIFTTARRLLDAYIKRRNREQNIGRASLDEWNTAVTLPRNQWIIPAFDNFSTISPGLRMWSRESNIVSGLGVCFLCQEPGYHNIKGGIDVSISLPAVPVTRITEAEAELIYVRADGAYQSLIWQASAYASVGLVMGPPMQPVQHYLRGFSLTFADKIRMGCGDKLWLHWRFTGAGDIDFVESYRARLAIQKTGDPFIDEECC